MVERPRTLELGDQISLQFGSIIFKTADIQRTSPIVVIEPAAASNTYTLGNRIINPFEDEAEILFMSPETLLGSQIDQVVAQLDIDQMRAAWRRGLENVYLFTPAQIEKTSMKQFEAYAKGMQDREQVIQSGSFRRLTR